MVTSGCILIAEDAELGIIDERKCENMRSLFYLWFVLFDIIFSTSINLLTSFMISNFFILICYSMALMSTSLFSTNQYKDI